MIVIITRPSALGFGLTFRCSFRRCVLLDLSTKHVVSPLGSRSRIPGTPVIGVLLERRSLRTMTTLTKSEAEAAEQVFFDNSVENGDILTFKSDEYGGIVVELKEHVDAANFTRMLRASIAHWRQLGRKGVWIKLPLNLAHLVEPAVKEGFWYHHAEPKYLMLVFWIPGSNNTLPSNASHRVGIGAFVINENGEVLVVQENSGRFRGTGIWKFPTGVVEEGEDISEAAVREVKEETGIETKFIEVLAFRQSHQSFFDKSDLFFLCMLQPVSYNIQKMDQEIEAAQWMPFEEYADQPFVHKHELFRYITDICLAKMKGNYSGFSAVPAISGFSGKMTYLYMSKGRSKEN